MTRNGDEAPQSDALVFFGATGDLAYKKIFPALQAMAKRGSSTCPSSASPRPAGHSINCARGRRTASRSSAAWTAAAFDKLCGRLRYVDGDYQDDSTFAALRRELGGAPASGALPGDPAAAVRPGRGTTGAIGVRQRAPAWWSRNRSARISRRRARSESDPARRVRRSGTSSASTTTSASGPFTTCCSSASRIRCSRRSGTVTHVESVQITMAEDFGVQGRGGFYDATGAIRDVVQNHLFQLLSNLAMEPPAGVDSESLRDEKVKVLKSIPALGRRRRHARTVPRLSPGTRRGRRFAGRDVRRHPAAHRFVAMAGRPVLHPHRQVPAGDLPRRSSSACGIRRRCSRRRAAVELLPFPDRPRQTIAFGMTAMDDADQMIGQRAELVASRRPGPTSGPRTSASWRRGRGRRHAVCADGLRRRGVAHRRSGADA